MAYIINIEDLTMLDDWEKYVLPTQSAVLISSKNDTGLLNAEEYRDRYPDSIILSKHIPMSYLSVSLPRDIKIRIKSCSCDKKITKRLLKSFIGEDGFINVESDIHSGTCSNITFIANGKYMIVYSFHVKGETQFTKSETLLKITTCFEFDDGNWKVLKPYMNKKIENMMRTELMFHESLNGASG